MQTLSGCADDDDVWFKALKVKTDCNHRQRPNHDYEDHRD